MKRHYLFRLLCVLPLVLVAALTACAGTVGETSHRQTLIDLQGHQARIMVAVTRQEHITGLMYRRELPEDQGMLFVYDEPRVRCMWMKNTYIPLSAAFLDDDGRILAIADMAPMTTNSHCSPGPVRYVLEMNQGWFARRGLDKGSRVDLTSIPR